MKGKVINIIHNNKNFYLYFLNNLVFFYKGKSSSLFLKKYLSKNSRSLSHYNIFLFLFIMRLFGIVSSHSVKICVKKKFMKYFKN